MNVPDNHDGRVRSAPEEIRWARSVLGVPDDATEEQEQAAVLARLEEANFNPAPQWEQAMLLLSPESPRELKSRCRQEVVRPREVALKEEVDRLAEDFFKLPVADRRARWQDMVKRCEFSVPLTMRLEELADGLDVVPPLVDGDPASHAARLTKDLCRAFVLPPSQRQAFHEEGLWRATSNPRDWQAAVREIRAKYPQVIPLGSLFIGTLSDFVRIRKAEAKAEAKKQAALARAAKTSSVRWPWIWFVIFAVANVGRVFYSHTSSQYPPSPSYTLSPNLEKNAVPEIVSELSEACKRGILPPRDPANYSGKSICEGEFKLGTAARRLFSVPDDVDVFREDGKLVFRRRAKPTGPQDPAISPSRPPDPSGQGER